jgi:endonuclease/exonuclease/phosphatase family metal-dependent hydrolase
VALIGVFSFAAPLRGETLILATYNVENYVSTNRMAEGTYRQSYPKPEAEKQALRSVLRGINADVLALQEMGPRPYLDELQHDLAAEGLVYRYAELLDAEDKERHLAVLSKQPLTAVRGYTELGFKYFGATETVKRGLLEVHVGEGPNAFALFIVHLKSRFTDRPDDPNSALRRAGEATAVRDQILRVFPQPATARFLIMGDCNDSRLSKPLRALAQRGKTDIAEVLPATDGHGETWTHYYKKEETYTHVDHVLVSAALKPAVENGAARIVEMSAVTEASDHRPVVVALKWK